MKNIFILFLTLCASAPLYTMENNMAIEPARTLLTFEKLPDDVQLAIFKHFLSDASKWEKRYEYHLGSAAATIMALQLVNKKCLNTLSPNIIAPLFNITETNKDLFLFRAAQMGFPRLVKMAIELKPNLDFVYTTDNKKCHLYGCTPLSVAVRYDNYKSCLYLLHAGASVNKPEEDPRDTGEYEIMPYANNYRPIHLAQNKKMLELLLDFKADVNAQDYHGKTALTKAVRVGEASLARALVKHGGTMLESCWNWLHTNKQLEELLAIPEPDEIDETELYDQMQVEKTS